MTQAMNPILFYLGIAVLIVAIAIVLFFHNYNMIMGQVQLARQSCVVQLEDGITVKVEDYYPYPVPSCVELQNQYANFSIAEYQDHLALDSDARLERSQKFLDQLFASVPKTPKINPLDTLSDSLGINETKDNRTFFERAVGNTTSTSIDKLAVLPLN